MGTVFGRLVAEKCFENTLQAVCSVFQKSSPKSNTHPLEKYFKNTDANLCSGLPKYSLGNMNVVTKDSRCHAAMCWFSLSTKDSLHPMMRCWDFLKLRLLWSFVTTLCSPNEDFGKSNKRWNAHYRGFFKNVSTRFGLRTIVKSIEGPCFIFCSVFQNLRLGSINFDKKDSNHK